MHYFMMQWRDTRNTSENGLKLSRYVESTSDLTPRSNALLVTTSLSISIGRRSTKIGQK